MQIFNIDIRMRPIRIAFVVPENSTESVLRAININSFLWGGHLNPIIPLITTIDERWKTQQQPELSAQQLFNGYLEAFDPDFVTYLNCDAQAPLANASHITIEVDEILSQLKPFGLPYYGVGYYELARYFGYEEMRFERKKPLHLVTPSIDSDCNLFLSSVIGQLPSEIADDVRAQLKDAYDAPHFTTSISEYHECLNRAYITPLRLIRTDLEPDEFARSWQRNYVFYLDANSLLDITDLWNLRALGFTIFPLPKQAAAQPKVLELLDQFIRERHAVSGSDPDVMYSVKVLRGRSIEKTEFKEFVATCPTFKELQPSPARPIIQDWFPRFWDRWERQHNECDCIRSFADSSKTEVTANDDRIRFNPLIPKYAERNSFGYLAANEVSISTYSDGEPIAQVTPQGSEELGAAFGAMSFLHEWRFSSAGLVHFPRLRSTASIGVPKSQPLVEKWFACDGWQVATSQAGLATRELLKHLGGAYSVSRIADENVVELLGELSKGRPITYKALRSRAWQIAKSRSFTSPDTLISTLMISKMVALGVQVKCSTCGRHPWYEMGAIRPVVECTECLRPLELPLYAPDKIEWAYRGIGPLVSLSTSSGAFPVVLTLRFFALLMHVLITPAFGLTLAKNGNELEIDLRGFVLESKYRRSRVRQFFAECKTYNQFCVDDVKRLAEVGTLYPGSILVFGTLRPQLTQEEIGLLQSLISDARQRVGPDEPRNPVMILTGNELFATHGITLYWEKLGGRHAKLAPQLKRDDDLISLCSITQQLYLDMHTLDVPTSK